jgi:ribose-phosphate pyrophosphokinase
VTDLFKAAGATRIMSVDLHTPQIQGFFDGPVDHLWALPLLADHIAATFGTENLTVVSPDSGRVRVADIWADRLGTPLAIVHKRRDPDRPNQVQVNEIVGGVEGRDCLLVDDMIDTGGTILAAAKALKANGAKRVIVAATHGVFSHPAVERLSDPVIDSVVVTNTLPITPDKEFATLTVLSIAPLIAKAIAAVFYDDSVNSLFPGHA